MNKIKNIHIFGGGTVAHIANHFAVCAPAYGNTSENLLQLTMERFPDCNSYRELTKMAGGFLETNDDVSKRIEELKKDFNTKIIFFNCALVDFEPKELQHKEWGGDSSIYETITSKFGKHEKRLESRNNKNLVLDLEPSKKIISNIRTGRKDIFLVGFKTTCGATKQEMYEKGLRLCKEGSCNLVLVNDTKTRWNMIVTPEEAAYHETDKREEALENLVEMTHLRSHLTFTQSTVVSGVTVPWSDTRVPSSLRTIVDHCVNSNAYKVFNGGTVGHFAHKLSDTWFLTSIRKSNFNELDKNGLVLVRTDGPDTVISYGAKPSVGGQSQRIVFNDHEGFDCIVHFHCPLRDNHPDNIPIVSQREVECGSHQCGQNTSNNLKEFNVGIYDEDSKWQPNIKVVMLDNHGPNIVFNKGIDPQLVINFIERNFDLTKKTGGYNI